VSKKKTVFDSPSFQEVWERVQKTTQLTTLTSLAKELGISNSSVSDAKKRNVFPLSWAYTLANSYKLSLDYLLWQEGDKFRQCKVNLDVDHQALLEKLNQKPNSEEPVLIFKVSDTIQKPTDLDVVRFISTLINRHNKQREELGIKEEDAPFQWTLLSFVTMQIMKIAKETDLLPLKEILIEEEGYTVLGSIDLLLTEVGLAELVFIERIIHNWIIMNKDKWGIEFVLDEYPYIKEKIDSQANPLELPNNIRPILPGIKTAK